MSRAAVLAHLESRATAEVIERCIPLGPHGPETWYEVTITAPDGTTGNYTENSYREAIADLCGAGFLLLEQRRVP